MIHRSTFLSVLLIVTTVPGASPGGVKIQNGRVGAARAVSAADGDDVTAHAQGAAAAYEARGVSKAEIPVARERGTRARVMGGYGALPLSFEANHGQTDSSVKFLSRGSGFSLFLTSNEAVLVLSQPRANQSRHAALADRRAAELKQNKSAILRMTMLNANPQSQAAGHDELAGKSNYFIGTDPGKWRTNVPTYATVRYGNVYPGVDLIYYGNQRQLEYDVIVAPGADPGLVTLAFDGAREVHIDGRGELVLRLEGGELRQHRPVVYQEVAGVKRNVGGRYVMKGKQQVGFRVAAYDPRRPLIIDPVLIYSTYLGGNADDAGYGIAVDGAGNAYVMGSTGSTDFPTTPGAVQTANAGSDDAFVTKLNATGSALVYSTYLGGSSMDLGSGIAVDGAGNAYVIGLTSSVDFPTTAAAAQRSNAGNFNAFVTKLDATGSALLYSTYLGGSSTDVGVGIAVDGADSAYVTGQTTSTDFPTTPGAVQKANAGGADAFVTKLDATGSTLLYSTYLGGGGDEDGFGIAVDDTGNAYVTGDTTSTNFPTTPGVAQPANGGGDDAFVTKLDATGSMLLYSTYLGGSGTDVGTGIAVDDAASAYVTGWTASTNFPTTFGAAQPTNAGGYDAFVTKLDATGSARIYSTYLGGSNNDFGYAIAVDDTGRAYVTGDTYSTDFPTTPGAAQTANAGVDDAFVTRLDATGSARLYSTYLGGSDSDFGQGIALDGAGSAYVTGQTFSTNFPTTAGAFQTAHAPDSGNVDAFVAKIEFVRPPATLTLAPAAAINVVHTQHCVTATVQDALGNPTPGIEVHFSVTGTTTTGGVVTTDRSGRATFCYIGATRAGADTITAFADTNDNDALDPGEPVGVAAKTWIAGAPAALVLAPATATNTVGAQHCVTATVTDAFGNPTPNVTVRATVTGTVRTSATGTTNAAGQFQFCYTSSLLGADAITAFADTNNNGKQDAGEPSGAATKTWVLPAGLATGCKVSGEGVLRTANGDRAAFEGDARSQTTGVVSGQQEYQDFGPARPVRVRSINVRALVQEGPTRVSVYGQATVNGAGSFAYRVTFDDQSGPGGHKDKYSILVSNGYASGEEIIQSGDIEVTCGLPDGDGRGHKDEEDHQGVKDRDGKHGGAQDTHENDKEERQSR